MNVKKMVCISLLLFISILVGCGKNRKSEDGVYSIYCLDREENKLCSYEWECHEKDMLKLAEMMIEEMKSIPDNVNYRQAVKDFEVTDYSLTENLLTINVTEDYRSMFPTTEILVRAALAHSLCQLEGVDYLSIKCHGEDLTDSQGIPIGKMNAEQFVDNSGNEINSYESVKLTLYFASADGSRLKKVVRTVEYNSNISLEKLVVEQLLEGPNGNGVMATINPQTKITNVTIKDGICYVSLDEAFLNIPEGISPEIMLYSIVNSLVELPNVNKVMINIDGSDISALGEGLSFETMYERNLELLE